VSPELIADDWGSRPTEQVAERLLMELSQSGKHIISFHDAGGDHTQTIELVEKLIPELKKQGYTFASLDEASQLPLSQLTPPLEGSEAVFVRLAGVWSFFRRYAWVTIQYLFVITTGLSMLRILFLAAMVLRSIRHPHYNRRSNDTTTTFVSVLVPAYNEEKTIRKTLSTLQKSEHRNFEAIVIDDGSTDRTAQVVQSISKNDPRIRCITKTNGGKSTALNLGFKEAKSDIIVTIDADTIFMPQTLTELIKPFDDPRVDAVCGNVEVGNANNLVTRLQSLEYITCQNFDRRAFEELNCISVVPGATGAWRKHRVLELGGYADDTLTEDADITLSLLRSGGRIVYAPAARSQTEAPETFRALTKQRFRWCYGTFQCLWKHIGLDCPSQHDPVPNFASYSFSDWRYRLLAHDLPRRLWRDCVRILLVLAHGSHKFIARIYTRTSPKETHLTHSHPALLLSPVHVFHRL
jgi:GT2 family glycosyltransferase